MKMRELEARTGVGRETIRFYIREGILPEPEKPKRNVADYSEEHVVRIRLIKELQEKRFLPLKVVKTLLDDRDTRELVVSERLPGIEHFLPALLDSTPGPERTVTELAHETGFSAKEIGRMAATGAIAIRPDRTVDFRDAEIVGTWAEAVAAGFDPAHGYQPEHLARFVDVIRPFAHREVDRFMAAIGDELDGEAAAKIGAAGVNAAGRLMTLMFAKFVLAALEERAQVP